MATTIGIKRTEDRATAKAAAGREAWERIAPTRTTFAGSAHTTPTMKTVSTMVRPASFASPAKPTNALARISPGMENAAPTPRPNHRQAPGPVPDTIGLNGSDMEPP